MNLFAPEPNPQWIRLCKLEELPNNQGKRFTVEGCEIAVFRTETGVFATDDYCPHMGDSLSAGRIWEGTVVCPRHMWAFRLTDGKCTDVPTLAVATYQVDVRDGWVYVKRPNAGSAE
jgi:NAD(P)H-dependent nitrite reductase small subunit